MQTNKQSLMVIATIACALPMTVLTDSHALSHSYGEIKLIRDNWGVPHIFAQTDAGAMYGLGYAMAEDRGFQMHYTLRIIQGRLAEVIGDVKKVRRDETALQSDRKMRTFGFLRAAKELVNRLDDESASLLEAYARGVNDCFEANRDGVHPLFEKLGLEREPWTPADCFLSWWHLAQFFATDGTRDLMHYRNLTQGGRPGQPMPPGRGGGRAARSGTRAGGRGPSPSADLDPLPPDDSAAVVGHQDVTDAWIGRTREFLREHGYQIAEQEPSDQGSDGPKFSHAWVADGKITGTGAAVLVSMPQTPVTNPSLFYEFHIRGKTFNARGVGVPGSPVILIGWNKNVAWGMTALGADQADLFRLKTDDEHPHQYLFDGQWRDMETVREEIKVKGGRSQSLEIRQTHFGPIINEFAFARPDDPPVALKRIPVCETDRETIQGALAMMRAGNVHEFIEALKGWRFPTANVLFGDSQGNIGYSTAGALPLRSSSALDVGGAAHDGTTSKCDWQAIIPHDLVPHVINPQQRYLFSGNHKPIGSFYPIPLGIRTGSGGDSVRSWRLRQLLAGKTSLTADEVLELFTDAVNPARHAIARVGYHLRDVLRRDLSPEALKALKHLEDWYAQGAPSRLDVPGAELGEQINTFFRFVATDLAGVYGGGESGLSRFLKTVAKRLDDDPQANIQRMEQQFVDNALSHAWNTCQRTLGPDPQQWNATARRQVTESKLGYYESLDGFPSLDAELDMNCPALACTDGATVFSQGAQAYVQWVPLANVDEARSLLPPGHSEQPDSPMRFVNVEGWTHGQLNPAPLSQESVQRIARSTRVLPQESR